MRVNVEEMEEIINRRKEVNAVPFNEIRWYKNGELMHIPKDKLEGWKYTGLSNLCFVETCLIHATD